MLVGANCCPGGAGPVILTGVVLLLLMLLPVLLLPVLLGMPASVRPPRLLLLLPGRGDPILGGVRPEEVRPTLLFSLPLREDRILDGLGEVRFPMASGPREAAMLPGGTTEGLLKLLVKGKLTAAASVDRLPLVLGGSGGGVDWYAALGEGGEVVLSSGPCCLAAGEADKEGEARKEAEEGVGEGAGEADDTSFVVFAAAATAAVGEEGLLMVGLVLLGAPAGVGARLPAVRLEPVAAPISVVVWKPTSRAVALTVLLRPAAAALTPAVPWKNAVLL